MYFFIKDCIANNFTFQGLKENIRLPGHSNEFWSGYIQQWKKFKCFLCMYTLYGAFGYRFKNCKLVKCNWVEV